MALEAKARLRLIYTSIRSEKGIGARSLIMSKLKRLIRRGRRHKHLSANDLAVYPDNAEVAPRRDNRDNPINALLPVGTDIGLLELTEVRDRLKHANLERGNTYTSNVTTRAISMELSSYREEKRGSRGLPTKPVRQYEAIFGLNFESLMTSSGGNDAKDDRSSLEFSLGDDDFELVLRHFWKHLDAEKRRKLIQMAAGLADGRGNYDWIEK